VAPATSSFFATTLSGLEHVLARELESTTIGAAGVREGHLGVHFEGTPAVGARAVMWCRSAMRVMELLDQREDVTTQADLYDLCFDLPWTDMFESEHQTLSVGAVLSLDRAMSKGSMRPGDWVCPGCSSLVFASKEECFKCGAPRDADPIAAVRRRLGQPDPDEGGGSGSEPLTHSHFSALTVKNAACDVLREARGWRPSVDKQDADVPLWLHVHRGDASVYRVLSGSGSLHRRGYREGERVHKAAMKETLAAAMLLHAGYDPQTDVLCDPMCGSGTIAIEAALIATNTAPGLLRPAPPALARWGGVYAAAWRDAVAEAEAARLLSAPRPIMANEIHPGALTLARRAAANAGVEAQISFSLGCAGEYTPAAVPTLVVSNPPWGLRLDEELAGESWSVLGGFLKRECRAAGNEAWLLSGNKELTRNLRLRARSRHPVEQGDDSLRIICYDMGPAPEKKEGEGPKGGAREWLPAAAAGDWPARVGGGAATAVAAPARAAPVVRKMRPAPRRSPAAVPGEKVILDGTGLSGSDMDAAFADLYD